MNFSSKRDDNNSNLNQIEESLKCFSYLDNLDDSLSLDDNNNNKKQTHSNTDNKKTYEALDKTKFNRQGKFFNKFRIELKKTYELLNQFSRMYEKS